MVLRKHCLKLLHELVAPHQAMCPGVSGSVAALGGIASDRQVAQRLLMFPLQQAPANAIAFEHFLYNAQFQLPVSARPFQLIQTHDPGLANILYLCHDCLIRAAVSDALQLSELGKSRWSKC